jgi:peptidoglycan hydrolase FlgJ
MDPVGPQKPLLPNRAPTPAAPDRTKTVAQKFEAVFLTEMLNQMMSTVKVGNLDGGHAEETWRIFLARAMADQIAGTGTTGIARSVEHMLKAYNGQAGGGDG